VNNNVCPGWLRRLATLSTSSSVRYCSPVVYSSVSETRRPVRRPMVDYYFFSLSLSIFSPKLQLGHSPGVLMRMRLYYVLKNETTNGKRLEIITHHSSLITHHSSLITYRPHLHRQALLRSNRRVPLLNTFTVIRHSFVTCLHERQR
jgi:hypothetical protein